MSPAGISPDARAVVRALEALTTQVRRGADALSTPVVRYAVAADDAPTTTADDGQRCVCGDPIELAGDPAVWRHSPGGTYGLDAHTPRPPDWPAAGDQGTAPATVKVISHVLPMTEQRAEEMQAHTRLVAEWADGQVQQAQATDEDEQRTTRRDSLRNLLTRAAAGLTPDEDALLRQHVEAEMRDADTARTEVRRLGLMVDEYSAGARALSETLRREKERADAAIDRETTAEQAAHGFLADLKRAWGERDRARAAIERMRSLRDPIAAALEQADYRQDMRRGDLADSIMPVIRAALDGTEQPKPGNSEPG